MASAVEVANQTAQAGFGTVSMWSYFKPLRRKVGVVTLVLACVLVAGWMRSLRRLDRIELPSDDRHFRLLLLYDGKIELESYFNAPAQLLPETFKKTLSRITQYTWAPGEFQPSSLRQSRHVRNLFRTSDNQVNRKLNNAFRFECTIKYIPYWSVVLPFTLLSAWLLLSKPKSKIALQPPRPVKLSIAALIIGGLPLLIYPAVLFASLMGLAGYTTGKEPFLLLVAAYSFHVGTIAYPAVFIPRVIKSINESNRGQDRRAYWISMTPLLYLTILACLTALMSIGATS